MDWWHLATVAVFAVGLVLEGLAGFAANAAKLAPILEEHRDGGRMSLWDRLWLRSQATVVISRVASGASRSSWTPKLRVADLWTARLHAWRGVTRTAVGVVLLARFALELPPPWLP